MIRIVFETGVMACDKKKRGLFEKIGEMRGSTKSRKNGQ